MKDLFDVDIKKGRELKFQGKTVRDIGNLLGVSRQTISRYTKDFVV